MKKQQLVLPSPPVWLCLVGTGMSLVLLRWVPFPVNVSFRRAYQVLEIPRSANATVACGKEPIKLSSTGPSSTLPSFLFMAQNEEGGGLFTGYNWTGGRGTPEPFDVKTSCPEDVFENTSPGLRVPQLPWRLQEDWGCERIPSKVDVLVLENEYLRAAIAPQWGGKIYSLYHKRYKRQLFFNNPAHQPANIGYRKAWSSGGCEWNWSPGRVGHSVFTEAPTWTAVLETDLGPLVRVWEYDRQNSTVWQVDMLLVEDVLYVHPKITNPTSVDLPGYWWTCVAMRIDGPRNRIVVPAEFAIDRGGQCSPWPQGAYTLDNTSFRGPDLDNCTSKAGGRGACAWQSDLSFLDNIPTDNDFFFHIAKGQHQHWITHVQDDGFSILHAHPSFLNGTKLFQWGNNEKGKFNEDFLSSSDYENSACNSDAYNPSCTAYKHEGAYTELQVGPARTQMHTFPLPKDSDLEWTEWFKAWQADPSMMQHENYNIPLSVVDSWLQGPDGMNDGKLQQVDALLKRMADVPPTPEQMVYKGMPWGGLQQKLQRKVSGREELLAPGCPFPEPEVTIETQPWLELLETGTFSEETLARTPVNFEVSDAWIQLLQNAVDAGDETWLHLLFLGTHALETGNVDAADFFRRSMVLKPTVHAARNLAIIAPTKDAAVELYKHACSLWMDLDSTIDTSVTQLGVDLSGEISGWLLGNERWGDLEDFLTTLGSSAATRPFLLQDRALHAQAAVAVQNNEFKKAMAILRDNCFQTYGTLRRDLLALWWTANKQNATASKGAELTRRDILDLRKRIRCDGDQSNRGIDDPCVCGPPNLGYQYG